MMMEKPKPKEEQTAPAVKKKSAEEAVQELEKRLAALGGPSPPVQAAPATNGATSAFLDFAKPPAPEAATATPASAAVAPGPAQVRGGKNALLARIMAAQEKAKTAAPAPPQQQQQQQQGDLLSPTPPITMPPPAYDSGLLSPPPPQEEQAPPPSFDAIEDHVMAQVPPPPDYSFVPPPPPATVMPSAPAFEDLLGMHQQCLPPPPLPPQDQSWSPEEEVIMGMEGLSPEERRALLEEQRQIMAQIEKEKSSNQAATSSAQADNFDMRSTSNAVAAMTKVGERVNLGGGQHVDLHGPERTKEAIQDGTAVLVQCLNCENWMQVTGNATLMYCPVCSVVSPVDPNTAAMSREQALQMEADRKMAEQLQSEEYERAERPAQRRPQQQQQQQGESWWGAVSSMFGSSTSETPSSRAAAPSSDERQSLASRPVARVAERAPLFSCVVDSVNSTVGTLTGTQLSTDQEGNVHGVDASSLLAVSNVGRENNDQNNNL